MAMVMWPTDMSLPGLIYRKTAGKATTTDIVVGAKHIEEWY